MGASNFHKVNASKYYVVCENEVDEETGEVLDFQDHDWKILRIKDYIESNGSKYGLGYYTTSFTDENELRSYPSRSLCSLHDCKRFGDVDIQIEIGVVIRSGYYEAANLDYNIRLIGLSSWYDSIPDLSEIEGELEYQSYMNKGLCKIQAKYIEKWLHKRVKEVTQAVETMFEEVSIPMQVAYRFSNGETGYVTA